MIDPIALLREFHREIETMLPVLVRLSDSAATDSLAGEERNALDRALSLFRDEAPQHAADEEESLFPRLRQEKAAALLPVLARIETLEEEHVCADRILVEIESLCQLWLRRGTLSAAEASRLTNLVAGMRDLYRHHIAVEETEVFPTAAAIFCQSTLDAIAGEISMRRGAPKQG